jgi:tyrosinase
MMAKKSRSRRASARAAPATPRITSPIRPTTPANTYTSKPVSIDFAGPSHRFEAADLQILGIDHSQSSYEGRVFFNNAKANGGTPKTLDNGYAGSFYIFGHGGCFGDVGHCEINEKLDSYDYRDAHPLQPTQARIAVTAALKQFAKTNSQITITVVPVVSAANELCDTKNVFHFQQMRFLTYNA